MAPTVIDPDADLVTFINVFTVDPSRQEELLALREAWDQGKSSGVAAPFDMKATIQRARDKRAAAPDHG